MNKRKSRTQQASRSSWATRAQAALQSAGNASRIGTFLIAVINLFRHE